MSEQENQGDLSNLTAVLVGLNFFERRRIQTQFGRQAMEVVQTNMDDENLCFLDRSCSVEEPLHNHREALLSLPLHPPNEKGG